MMSILPYASYAKACDANAIKTRKIRFDPRLQSIHCFNFSPSRKGLKKEPLRLLEFHGGEFLGELTSTEVHNREW